MEEWMKKGKGCSIPISMKDNQFTVSMDVEVNACDQETEEDWKVAKKKGAAPAAKACGVMRCFECGLGDGLVSMPYFAPLASGV